MPALNELRVENHGTVILIRPLTGPAKDRLRQMTGTEAQWFGGALVCEPRYVEPILHDFNVEA